MKLSPRTIATLLILVANTASTGAITFTNDSVIHSFDRNYDGGGIVISNCTVRIDGSHAFSDLLVAAGGTLTHTFSPTGIVTILRSFTNEAQILSGTNAVSLVNTGALSSAEVTDFGGTVTYTNNQDYTFTIPGNGLIQLQRTFNSAIPDGATVLVNYVVAVSTTAGLNLSVTGTVEIAAGGAINVNGRGYGGNTGTGNGGENLFVPYSGGGAGYGGFGGASSSNAPGGTCYGSYQQPTDLGSGGGYGSGGSSAVGGAGGGAVKIFAGGDMIINGNISANGANATNSRSGGGSGGSVWLSGQTISGGGIITANGGAGEPIHGGGGGGGRIAVQADTNNFAGQIAASGGAGAIRGGAGTIYTKVTSQNGSLVLDNGGLAGTNTLLQVNDGTDLTVGGRAIGAPSGSQSIGNLLVSSNGLITALSPNFSVTITSAGDTTIEAGGQISVAGLGPLFSTGSGSASGTSGTVYGGGGGHGGSGGMGGNPVARGGGSFDSTTSPSSPGGAGGGGVPFNVGRGGGVVLLTVNGNFVLDGGISADGSAGGVAYSGGGAGGSIRLSLGTWSGSGTVSASGGSGYFPGGGGGGGGRIAIVFNTNAFAGTVTAYGGTGTNVGGAGTIYIKTNSESIAQLILDNGGIAGTNSTAQSSYYTDINIARMAALQLGISGSTAHNILIQSNGTLTTTSSGSVQNINASGDVTINPGGLLTLDGTGYSPGQGPGYGFSGSSSLPRGGGGHGGYGGANTGFGIWGSAYDWIVNPANAGSGGASAGSTVGAPPLGGAGGGALYLNVAGALTINGKLSANGGDGQIGSGGGGGGALNIICGTLNGSGPISANGGTAGSGSAGGGGGGRIAIQFGTNDFGGSLAAAGGNGLVAGGAGTIYVKRKTASRGDLFIDNGGLIGTNTPVSTTYNLPPMPFNLAINSGARVEALTPLTLLSNLTIGANSLLSARTDAVTLTLNVVENVNIAPGAALSMNGKGFARAAGPGAGNSISSQGSGGGYGGVGGASGSGAAGGTNYGSATQPVDRGSGGGAGAYTYFGGSEGGGAIRLIVGGTLNVDGTLSADGNPGFQDDSGGGAGGSIWVVAGAVSGSGIISANGGAGELFGGGGGGGGRIAIQSPSNTFAGTLTTLGGFGATFGSDGTLSLTGDLPTIQGTVTDTNGLPVAGVLLQTSSGTASTTTAADGTYALSLVPYTNVTVTPSYNGFMFVPGSRNYSASFTSVSNANYLMVTTITPAMNCSLQDTNLVVNWLGIPGVSYQLYSSTNLVDWLPYGAPIVGSNVVVEIPVPVDSDPMKFFRLRASN